MYAWLLTECLEHHTYITSTVWTFNLWKRNVMIYIWNGFRINYVRIFCPMVNTFWPDGVRDKQEPSLRPTGPVLGTNRRPSLGQTGRFLSNSTAKSPLCPVYPWDGWGFVPVTIVPQGLSEKCLCVLCLLVFCARKLRQFMTNFVLSLSPSWPSPNFGLVGCNKYAKNIV